MRLHNSRLLILMFSLSLTTVGCSVTTTTTTVLVNGIPSGPPEKAYCPYLPVRTFSGTTVTITGSAGYYYRQNDDTNRGSISSSTRPIRYAEVNVYDKSGALIQCTETDSSGNFQFTLPNSSYTHTVTVASRAYNSHARASVLNYPEYNVPFEVGVTFTPDSTKTLSQIRAQADQTVDAKVSAGAFNILDKIVDANEYLTAQTASCTSYSGCTPFTTTPKLQAYWSAGFNPYTYYGEPDKGVSFYLTGQNRLFILGGFSGDVDNSDNDQFDASVIVHEYGHFIEDNFGHSNSPGGQHDGNSIIDPRLAWGEGWADFFQGAVTGIAEYRDSQGTSDGTWTRGIVRNLETDNTYDVPTSVGEGIYHEFSVTRALWDALDSSSTDPVADGVSIPFAELWNIFTNSTSGLTNTSLHFRNMSLWHKLQTALNQEDLSSIRTASKQDNTLSYYATPMVTGGSCTHTGTITGYKSAWDNGSFDTSDLFRSNRFLHLTHAGGSLNLKLDYTFASSSTDLDLYLYKEDYVYGDTSTMVAYSNSHSVGSSGGSETISIGNLGAGHYMVNIMVYTKNTQGSVSTYDLTYNNSKLCPNP